MGRLKTKKLVPINNKGEQINMLDTDFKNCAQMASRRTHMLGLYAAIGDITLKEALQAAYFQGMNDLIVAQEL